MLIRISLIVAIVAGLAAAGISFTQVKTKMETVKKQRDDEKQLKETAQKDLAKTRSDLDKTTKQLKQTETELASTKDERDKAVAEADKQLKRAGQLNEDLNKAKGERDQAQAELAAWAALGIPVNQVKEVIALAKQLQNEKEEALLVIKKLGQDKARLENELARIMGKGDYTVKLPAQLRGTVLVADPKWDFVILDVGADQGVLEYGELLVNRNGKLVAKVIVRNVQKGRCVANVMPGWKLGDVTEGDQVIPAHPAS
jgi:predicted nuclease with TOPRIM domain